MALGLDPVTGRPVRRRPGGDRSWLSRSCWNRAAFWRCNSGSIWRPIRSTRFSRSIPSQPDALYQLGALAMQRGASGRGPGPFRPACARWRSSDPRAAELISTGAAARCARPGARSRAGSIATGAGADGSRRRLPSPTRSSSSRRPPGPAAAPERRAPPHPPLRPRTRCRIAESADSDDLGPRPRRQTRSRRNSPSRGRRRSLWTVSDATPDRTATQMTVAYQTGSGRSRQHRQVGAGLRSSNSKRQRPSAAISGRRRRPQYLPTDTLEDGYIDRNLAQLQLESNLGRPVGSVSAGMTVPAVSTSSPNSAGRSRATRSLRGSQLAPRGSRCCRSTLDAGSLEHVQFGPVRRQPAADRPGLGPACRRARRPPAASDSWRLQLWRLYRRIWHQPLGLPGDQPCRDGRTYAPKFIDNTLTIRFEALRQPVTDSVLSYAGTHAPRLSGTANFAVERRASATTAPGAAWSRPAAI